MFARVTTVAFEGTEARGVDVQVQIGPGVPAFTIVGLPDKAVAESRERVRGALNAIGLGLPPKRITVNLAPADLPKEGSHYDLPIALGLMAAVGAIARDAIEGFCVLGELALDGSIATVAGALPAAIGANALGKGLICPASCGAEAAWAAADMTILAPSDLLVLINHFKGLQTLRRPKPTPDPCDEAMPDLKDIKGQETAKRARSRGSRRPPSPDDRAARRGQVDAGKAAALDPAAARAGRDARSEHDQEPSLRPRRRAHWADAALPRAASFGEHGRSGRRRHAAASRRSGARPSRRAVPRRVARVQSASARCAAPAARNR
jgi:magnesium chelatase family protein